MILHAQQNWFGPDLKSFQLSVSFWSALRWSSIVSKILLCSMSALLSFCYSCWCQLAVAGADWLVFCSCQDNAFHIRNIHTTQVWTAKLSIGTLCSTKAHVFLCSTFFFIIMPFSKRNTCAFETWSSFLSKGIEWTMLSIWCFVLSLWVKPRLDLRSNDLKFVSNSDLQTVSDNHIADVL